MSAYKRNYKNSDYQLVCDFLIEINKNDKTHINWNWARLEWMIEHPEFNKEEANKIGLWFDNDKLVATAIYDMYFGEASCLTLPGYEYLFDELLDYAYNNLKDENGLGICINKNNTKEIEKCMLSRFVLSEQKEFVATIVLDKEFDSSLKNNLRFKDFDPSKNVDEVAWVIYQGFDHGNNREEFEKQNKPVNPRVHFNPYLSSLVETKEGEGVAYCSLWYDSRTDYAYLEPLCVIPEYRKMGVGKALVYELLNRAKKLGAKEVVVISDNPFYQKIGFRITQEYEFYWKK